MIRKSIDKNKLKKEIKIIIIKKKIKKNYAQHIALLNLVKS